MNLHLPAYKLCLCKKAVYRTLLKLPTHKRQRTLRLRWKTPYLRFLNLWFVGMVLAFALFACTQPSPSNPPSPSAPATSVMPSEVRIGYQLVPNAEVLAKSLGLVEQAFPDTRVRWTAFPAGWKINAAMLEGEIDIGLVGSLPVSTAIAQGLPLKVYIVHNIINDNAALAVTKASGIQTMADLPGKRIAVPFGSTSHFSLLAALEQANIDSSAVNIIDMSISELLLAWEQNTIDGSFVWQTTLSKMLSADGKAIITAGEVGEKGAVTADLGTVSNDFLAAYPDFLPAFIDVLEEATEFYRKDPAAAAEVVANEVSLSPEDSLAVMKEFIWLDIGDQSSEKYMGTPKNPGAISQVLKDSADFMARQQAIPPAPDLETFQQSLLNRHFAA